jgi:hypothetical protein
MYYICKFSESWAIYDVNKNSSRPLDKSEIDCVKSLFPSLWIDNSKILVAIQVSTIQPNKLLNLPRPENNGSTKKQAETVSKS